jgi:hypothetical protein
MSMGMSRIDAIEYRFSIERLEFRAMVVMACDDEVLQAKSRAWYSLKLIHPESNCQVFSVKNLTIITHLTTIGAR